MNFLLMGPLFKFKKGDTEYSLRALPIGDTVKWKVKMKNQQILQPLIINLFLQNACRYCRVSYSLLLAIVILL